VTECVLLGNDVGSTAVPELKGTVPSTICVPLKLSTNWIVPVAALGETLPVKFTVCPEVAGFTSTVSEVEVLN